MNLDVFARCARAIRECEALLPGEVLVKGFEVHTRTIPDWYVSVNTKMGGFPIGINRDNHGMDNYTIQDIRRINLIALIDQDYGGNKAALARDTGVKENSIYRLLSDGKGSRKISDKMARLIEQGAKKPQGWMDVLHDPESDSELDQLIREIKEEDPVALKAVLLALRQGRLSKSS